jgi:SOS-response transcriptional repressor LexA
MTYVQTGGMTPRLKSLFDYIVFYIAESGGVSPTYREIIEALELKSQGHVNQLLLRLQERGFIEVDKGRARSIRLTGKNIACCPRCGHDLNTKLGINRETSLPEKIKALA